MYSWMLAELKMIIVNLYTMYRQFIDVSDVLEPTIVLSFNDFPFRLSTTWELHIIQASNWCGLGYWLCRIYVYVYIRLCGAWGNMGNHVQPFKMQISAPR